MFSAPVSVEPSRGCDNGRTVQVGPGTQVSDYPTNQDLSACGTKIFNSSKPCPLDAILPLLSKVQIHRIVRSFFIARARYWKVRPNDIEFSAA
jgi:hypothetical protein